MILITGASDGLRLQVAKLYKEAGKTVVNISRRESEFADFNICYSLSEESEIKKRSQKYWKLMSRLKLLSIAREYCLYKN